nr:pancreatic triacylglycerol lipase-like isoform X1 [Procambarus clarkii]XP_045613285.1 pancreatic triacylglycerol lipase-like isoform X1 [Procambarus clarkii]XP_045613286.1 pancreatic triacylglycerol lipase-like isoform X1 [Procambarus clarkii]
MSEAGVGESSSSSSSNNNNRGSPPEANMDSPWPLSLRTIAATFSVFMAVLVFHPSLVNFLVSSEETSITLNNVQNFFLWTRRHKAAQELEVGSHASLAATRFYPHRTYIIIHGFLGSGTDGWIISMKDALLSREDCNVISVNWAAGSLTAEYYMIRVRVPSVGEDVSKLLVFLQHAAGLTPDLVHIIGHSLGAHAAGFAGKKMNGTLSRITGLDPAGHMYHQVDSADRLYKTDAAFVDVIHTHGCTTLLSQWTDCYGIDENLGDADFWPNGGERQPACAEGGDGPSAVKDGSSCDHGMAYVLYTESIIYSASTTHFLARPCNSWKMYNTRICPCSYPSQYMGFNVNPNAHGVFYLNTSITAPYALPDPGCSAGAFSTLQIIGLVHVAVLMTLMIILVMLALVQQYVGIPVVTRLRVVLGMDEGDWQGFKGSPSSQLLAAGDKVIT